MKKAAAAAAAAAATTTAAAARCQGKGDHGQNLRLADPKKIRRNQEIRRIKEVVEKDVRLEKNKKEENNI